MIQRKIFDKKGRYLEFDVLSIAKKKKQNVVISINQHPNGKLNLGPMPKKDAIKILEFKGYL